MCRQTHGRVAGVIVADLLRRLPSRRARGGTGARANERIAVWVTARVGTMVTAYLFAALTLVSLPAALASRDALVIVSWIAQTFLQLVLLPVILVGQDVQARRTEKTITDTHTAVLDALTGVQSLLAELADSHADTHTLLAQLADSHADTHTLLAQLRAIATAVNAQAPEDSSTPDN
jgi:uncharacterized membrane protein